MPDAAPPVAHTLTLEFGRFLTEEEFRTVIAQVKAHVPHVQGLRADAVPDGIHVGDKMRVSTALLQEIHAASDHHSHLVEVARIDRDVDADGCLSLLLKKVDR